MHMFVCLMVVLGLLRLCSGSFLLFAFCYSEFIISIFPSLCSPDLFLNLSRCIVITLPIFYCNYWNACSESSFPLPSLLLSPFPTLSCLFSSSSFFSFYLCWISEFTEKVTFVFLFLCFYSLCLVRSMAGFLRNARVSLLFSCVLARLSHVFMPFNIFFLKNKNKAPNTHYDLYSQLEMRLCCFHGALFCYEIWWLFVACSFY